MMRAIQIALRTEVLVQNRFGHPGGSGQFPGSSAAKPFLREQVDRRANNRVAPLGALHSDSHGVVRCKLSVC